MMKSKKPKRRIPLPLKTGGIHKPKKGKGSYKRIKEIKNDTN